MSIFKRLWKVSQAEAHSAISKMENPIKMTEQGIRDLKKDLDESLKALAEVKAMAIRARRDVSNARSEAKSYESKAVQLLQRAQNGNMDENEADRLAQEALNRKPQSTERATQAPKEVDEKSLAQLDKKVQQLKSNIATWENELKTLKARDKVNKAATTVNKQMANIDTSSTVSMLERMKDKVEKDEALADAYGDMADENKTLDEEIDDALKQDTSSSDELAALKRKLKGNE